MGVRTLISFLALHRGREAFGGGSLWKSKGDLLCIRTNRQWQDLHHDGQSRGLSTCSRDVLARGSRSLLDTRECKTRMKVEKIRRILGLGQLLRDILRQALRFVQWQRHRACEGEPQRKSGDCELRGGPGRRLDESHGADPDRTQYQNHRSHGHEYGQLTLSRSLTNSHQRCKAEGVWEAVVHRSGREWARSWHRRAE